MDPKTFETNLDLEIQIEELEAKIAPDGGENVLPLGCGGGHHHG
jgi:hypothetical protein